MRIPLHFSGLPIFAATALVSLVSIDQLSAQGGPVELQKTAVEAMQKGDYEGALQTLDRAIRVFDKRAKQLGIGDKFGWFWYQKGVCESALKKNHEAIATLEEGIKKYPGAQNDFIRVSYLKIAEAAIACGEYEVASKYLTMFIKYRTETPAEALSSIDRGVNLGLVYALLAHSNFNSNPPAFDEGVKNIKLVGQNRYKGQGVPDAPIINAFLSMVSKSIAEGKPEVVLDFLKDGRSVVAVEAWRMPIFVGGLLRNSLDAQNKVAELEGEKAAQMLRVSQELMALIPDTKQIQQSANDVIAHLGDLKSFTDTNLVYSKDFLTKLMEDLNASIEKSGQAPEAVKLMTVAAQYIQSGAYRAAKAAYKILHEEYKELDAISRENNLYNLILVSSALGEMLENQELVKEFIKEFPTSEKGKTLNSMSLETLIVEKKYEEAIALSEQILKQPNLDPKVEEMAKYAQSAAMFNLNRLRDAIPLLEAFVQTYPDSPYAPQIMYFVGSAFSRTSNPERAAHAYNLLIKRYPDKEKNPFLPYAHYERGVALSNAEQDDDKKKAFEDFDAVINGDKEFPLYAAAFIGKGILQEKLEQIDNALASYKQGLEAAQKANIMLSKAEALYRLTSLMTREKKYKEAAEYYDAYYKEFAQEKTVFSRLQTAVSGLEALSNVNRSDEGLSRLGEMIVFVGRDAPENPLVESAIVNYTDEYLNNVTKKDGDKNVIELDKVKSHFFNFPGLKPDDHVLATMLRMAVIGVYETELKKIDKQDTAKRAALEAQIKVFFDEIQKAYKVEDLTPYTLAKIGNYFIDKSSNPDSAVIYFEEILKRGANADKFKSDAQFGLAAALGKSKDPAKIDKAISMMEKSIVDLRADTKPEARKNLEKSEYNLMQFYFNKGEFKKAQEVAYKYLEDKNKKAYRTEASWTWAESSDKANEKEQALKGYQRIVANYTGTIRYSAPAMKRQIELLIERDKPKPDLDTASDKLLAYQSGARYIKMTKSIFEKMNVDERNAWREVEDLVKRWGSDAGVAQEEKNAEERARARSGQK